MKFSKLRENKLVKSIALFIAANMLTQLAFPTVAMALTSGPSTPEVQSFEPVGTTEMVDLFTGDFTYNIPLFELPGPNGGYPFNLAYHSGIGMDQEASWAGLGWNINPGTINRAMNGLPDDFKGDKITKTTDMKDNITFGAGVGANGELFGANSNVSGGFELKVYYNNYKGVGYSLDPSMGLSMGNNFQVGVGISLDSQEGVGANASLSISSNGTHGKSSINGGIGFNSRTGLGYTLGMSVSKSSQGKKNGVYTGRPSGGPASSRNKYSQSMGGSSAFSFAEVSYTPVVSLPMRNRFIDFRYKTGTAIAGVFANLSVRGFYSTQYLKKAGKPVTHLAYGYNYMEDAGEEDLLDFNRSKDGVIRKESSNLAIPRLTYDYYNVMGQGVGGMYRPYRSDIGVIHDPLVNSNTFGGAGGVDIGPSVTPHTGVAGTATVGSSKSGLWQDDNQLDDLYAFIGPDGPLDENDIPENEIYESVYYKAHGEMTTFPKGEMDFMGGEEPVRALLPSDKSMKIKTPTNDFVNKDGVIEVDATTENIRSFENKRAPRNMSVQPVTNEEMGGGSESTIGEYQINYYDGFQAGATPYSSTPGSSLDRLELNMQSNPIQTLRKKHHIGGITSVNTDGVRYVYGLPAYNKEDKEYIFSVGDEFNTDCSSTIPIPKTGSGKNKDGIYYEQPNTNNYFQKTELPSYAYSYLLTSILGTDYVDVNGNGPDDADYGYWVKFNYVKTNDAYQWRAPFTDANYNKGLESTSDDNTGAFKIGTKEVYHLATVETKTHIAVFKISSRTDGLGALATINEQFLPDGVTPNPIANTTDPTNSGAFKLEKISLFVKNEYQNNTANAVPIKEVLLEYDNSLCQGTQNAATGKLTLKKLKFTHQNNKRGELAPYIFDYNSSNPDYSQKRYDRWGNYKEIAGANDCDYLESPYVQQFDETFTGQDHFQEKIDFQAIKDSDASAWHLSQITLPTGGTIEVKFEADDYAYVQNKTAQQMFKIDRLTKIDLDTDYTNDNKIYDVANPNPIRKVYFKLETPIKQGSNDEQIFENRYIDGLHTDNGVKQLYYKIKVNLRDGFEEYIPGYADLSGWGLDTDDPASLTNVDIDDNGPVLCYTKGYIELAITDINGPVNYHPFAVAAWQHMRTVQPDLLHSVGSLSDPGTNSATKLQQVLSLASTFSQLLTMFKDYRKHAFDRDFAQTINLDQSVIRLCSPDKKKYGGGQRVKQIKLSDEWGENPSSSNAAESLSTYGQVYDYTLSGDGTGESSGVAQYEPIIGGDENAMRYAKNYPQSIKHFTDNNLFFEFPINESYFPAPVVGYRKVTVRSLATKQVMDDNISGTNHTPTTGISVSEFYTAKDYPVIVEETDIQNEQYHLFVPIPLIGQIKIDNLTASQGYSIILNDMHGKTKANANYAITIDGTQGDKISSVAYHYHHKAKLFPDETSSNWELDNEIETINTEIPDGTGNNLAVTRTPRIMGVEYEFFTDMRSSHSESTMGGLQFNNDQIGFVPAFFPWPTFNSNTNNLNTVVTNKVIHKAGILERTVVTDGLSEITTKNLLHDEQTGRVLLSSITNNSDVHTRKYKYDIPAHWKYEKGMGAAYKNYGLTFTATTTSDLTDVYATTYSGDEMDHLVAGDEFVVKYGTTSSLVTYLGESKCETGKHLFYSDETITDAAAEFFLYRSGRRNQLTANVSSILALDDPTMGIDENLDCTGDVYERDCMCAPALFPDQLVNFFNNVVIQDGRLEIGTHQFTGYTSLIAFFGSIGYIYVPSVCDDPTANTNHFELNSDCNTEDFFFHQGNIIHAHGIGPAGCYNAQTLDYVTRTPNTNILNFHFTSTSTVYSYTLNVKTKTVGNNLVSTNVPVKYTIDKVLQTSAIELSDNFNPNTYYTPEGLLSDGTELVSDAYQTGDRGIWRAKKSYAYFADRKGDNTDVNTGDDGIINNPVSFFNFEYPELFTSCDPNWKLTNEITQYNNAGHEVENKNILGIYSSAKYDGNDNLPILVASNTRYDEAYFESFEEAGTSTTVESHTGQKSLAVSGTPLSFQTNVIPTEGKKFILSAWIKWPESAKGYTNKLSLTDPGVSQVNGVNVEFKVGYTTIAVTSIEPVGEVIEGWQKVEGEFIVPAGGITSIAVAPSAAIINSVPQTVYFDDIRIFPADGNIKTFVYDPITFRLSATLDENNYASFYYYDESGSLFLIKIETEEGVKTVQESRNHISE